MKKELNQSKIEEIIKNLIAEIGDDISRPGLVETPRRAAQMLCEMFEGMQYNNDEIAEMFDKCFEYPHSKDLVLVKNISIFSFCEHHLALMYNMKVHIGYVPKDKIIGISKIARIANMVSKRLQLQERIGSDIAYIMQKVLNTQDVMVVIEGEHSCMNARGAKAIDSKTRTNTTRGIFETEPSLRSEVLQQL